MTANESITRQIENHLIDLGNWRRNALADNAISDDEWQEGMPILDHLVAKVSELTITVSHVQNCLGGADGLFSYRAKRGWNEAQRSRGNIVSFPTAVDAMSRTGD